LINYGKRKIIYTLYTLCKVLIKSMIIIIIIFIIIIITTTTKGMNNSKIYYVSHYSRLISFLWIVLNKKAAFYGNDIYSVPPNDIAFPLGSSNRSFVFTSIIMASPRVIIPMRIDAMKIPDHIPAVKKPTQSQLL